MKITIGQFKNSTACFKALTKADINVSSYAKQVLEKIPYAQKKEEIEVVVVKVKDLGFTSPATLKEICARAKEKGYDLLPAEAGAALRLQFTDQPFHDYKWIAMEPIADSDGYWDVLCVHRHEDGLWLSSPWLDLARLWDPEHEFVFRKLSGTGKSESLGKTVSEPLDTRSLELRQVEALEKIADWVIKTQPKKRKK